MDYQINQKFINNKNLLLNLLGELKENIKESHSVTTKKLISIKESLIIIVEEILLYQNSNDKILDQELINYLSFFENITSYIKDSNILLEIKNFINDILNIIFEENNFPYITEPLLFQETIKIVLTLIHNNQKSNLIFFILLKKIDNYIYYISTHFQSYKEKIMNLRNSFNDNYSEILLNYKKELEKLNIYNLSKSKKLVDKKQALSLLTKIFNNFKYFTEKYEFLNLVSSELFPSLLNLTLPALSHKKNLQNLDLYISFGKFLLKFVFAHEYIFDFSHFYLEAGNIPKKYPCLFLYNKKEISSLVIINNKRYKILYKYDIIKEYSEELIDTIVKYFIKPMIIYDTNFEIQLIIFNLIKYLYFICKNKNENIKSKFSKYIPEILNNLSLFKKQDEFNKSSESREFGYYLLLKDKNFKYMIKSLTCSPKNDSDVYTQKFNVASELLNNWLYEKEEIENGKSFEIIQKVYKKYTIIYLEFYTEDEKEITVTVYKKNEKEDHYNQIGFNNIIKTLKNENDKNNIYKIAKVIIINSSSSINNENELNYKNEFKIIFDNCDSWFSNRIIHYSISVFDNL